MRGPVIPPALQGCQCQQLGVALLRGQGQALSQQRPRLTAAARRMLILLTMQMSLTDCLMGPGQVLPCRDLPEEE